MIGHIGEIQQKVMLDRVKYTGHVRTWPWLASENSSPKHSLGKAGRHILGPFPHSSGAVTAGLRGNSSDHPGSCLHAGTSHSATQV